MRQQEFKVTAQGRELLSALLETGKGLEITRVAVGSGQIPEGEDLAGRTELIRYEAEGALAGRWHEGNQFFLTVQYSSSMTPGKEAFLLDEFIVEARHPVSGENVALLYGTLGELRQPVVAWSDVLPPSIYNYPLTIVVSDEIRVLVSAQAGLVTYEELRQAVGEAAKEWVEPLVSGINKSAVISVPAGRWKEERNGGTYPWKAEVPCAVATAQDVPVVVLDRESLALAGKWGVCTLSETVDGGVRLWAAKQPQGELTGRVLLMSRGGGGSGSYLLPVASETELGGVKIGANMDIGEDGTLTADIEKVLEGVMATDEEAEAMLDRIFGAQ